MSTIALTTSKLSHLCNLQLSNVSVGSAPPCIRRHRALPVDFQPSQPDDTVDRLPEIIRRSDYSKVRTSVLREPHRKVFGEGESGSPSTYSMHARSPRKVQGKLRWIKAFFLACPRSTRRVEEPRSGDFRRLSTLDIRVRGSFLCEPEHHDHKRRQHFCVPESRSMKNEILIRRTNDQMSSRSYRVSRVMVYNHVHRE